MVGAAAGGVCLIETAGGAAAWASEHLRRTIHKPVLVHLCPQTIVRPRYTMVQLIFVKDTVHPPLHMVTTERREWDARPGMIWAARAPAAGVSGLYLVPIGKAGNEGCICGHNVGGGCISGEDMACCS
jgi:hypothetical protein